MAPIASHLRLSQRQSQRSTLTLVQRQSVELLQLTAPELQSTVDEVLAANPLLEAETQDAPDASDSPDLQGDAQASPIESARARRSDDAPDGEGFENETEALPRAYERPEADALEAAINPVREAAGSAFDAAAGMDSNFERSKDPAVLTWKKTAESASGDEEFDPYARLTLARTLTDHLMEQLSCSRTSETVRLLTGWLIGNLDDEGFLSDPIEEIFSGCPVPATPKELQAAVTLLQSFDPAGVGARSATDALLLQLKRREEEAAGDAQGHREQAALALAQALLTQCPAELMRHDFKAAARTLSCSPEEAQQAFDLIAGLNPHPASAFADVSDTAFVVPEILVTKMPVAAADDAEGNASGYRWVARLNTAIVPRLRFDFENFELLTRAKLSREEKTAWNKMAGDARNFVHALEFRFSTITAVAQKIVELQKSFFQQGPAALRPLQLKDVAAALGMSESTVSRATAGKYMQTPLGTFELKYFFGTGYTSQTGDAVSAAAIRRRIRELVAAEDPAKPLSDAAIAEALAAGGVQVARRTIAKYRELEHIAPRSLRKNPR